MKLYCGLYGSQDHQLHNVVGVYGRADSHFYSAHAMLYLLLHWLCCLVRQPSLFLRLLQSALIQQLPRSLL